jgi:hypothetical protein
VLFVCLGNICVFSQRFRLLPDSLTFYLSQ